MKSSRQLILCRIALLLALATPAPSWSAQPQPDACGGSPQCFDAGAFIAEVTQVIPTSMGNGARHQSLAVNVRFRNVGDKPVILAYRATSSAGVDNYGNRYLWGRPGTHDVSVKGIGLVEARKADPQFALNPGQVRSATFNVIRYNAVAPFGTAYSYDVLIDELEILPGQQIRSVRQNSLTFTNLSANLPETNPATAVIDVAESLKSIFGKKK